MWSWDGNEFHDTKAMKEITKENIRKNVCNKYSNAYKAHKISKKTLTSQLKRWWERGNPHKNKQRLSEFIKVFNLTRNKIHFIEKKQNDEIFVFYSDQK